MIIKKNLIVLLSLVIVYLVLINIFSSMVDLSSLLTYEYNDTINLAISMPGNDLPMPGVRCPTCAANGQEVWVLPGKACAYCGTTCG